jgi:predicted transcriptional regulator
LIKALGEGAVRVDEVARVMDRPPDVAAKLLADLLSEGLVVIENPDPPNPMMVTFP